MTELERLELLWGDHDVSGHHHDNKTCPHCQEIIAMGHKMWKQTPEDQFEELNFNRKNRYGDDWEERVIKLHDQGYSMGDIRKIVGAQIRAQVEVLKRNGRKPVKPKPVLYSVKRGNKWSAPEHASNLSVRVGMNTEEVKAYAVTGRTIDGMTFKKVRERGY
ncbi:MAG: hypothetical protein WCS15_09160 [Prevotella sp.]